MEGALTLALTCARYNTRVCFKVNQAHLLYTERCTFFRADTFCCNTLHAV